MATWDSKNGRYVYGPSERVDYSSIKSICNKIINEAEKLDKCANDKWNTSNNLENAAKDVNSDKVLMVNGRHYDGYITGIQGEMTKSYKALKTLAEDIKSAANSRCETEKSQYSAYLWRKQQEEEEAAKAASTVSTCGSR